MGWKVFYEEQYDRWFQGHIDSSAGTVVVRRGMLDWDGIEDFTSLFKNVPHEDMGAVAYTCGRKNHRFVVTMANFNGFIWTPSQPIIIPMQTKVAA